MALSNKSYKFTDVWVFYVAASLAPFWASLRRFSRTFTIYKGAGPAKNVLTSEIDHNLFNLESI